MKIAAQQKRKMATFWLNEITKAGKCNLKRFFSNYSLFRGGQRQIL